eukprot:scaffold181037_cov33-Tisochrysis_lutea.AAC.2
MTPIADAFRRRSPLFDVTLISCEHAVSRRSSSAWALHTYSYGDELNKAYAYFTWGEAPSALPPRGAPTPLRQAARTSDPLRCRHLRMS